MLEKIVEKKLISAVNEIGGRAYKFSSPGNNGVPDRIVLYKGNCYFVELKRPGGSLSRIQSVVIKRFDQMGFKVHVIDSVDKVGDFISGIQSTSVSGSSD